MAPPSSQTSSSSSPSLKRKQPTIANFFTKKTPTISQPPSSNIDAEKENDKKARGAAEDEPAEPKTADGITDEDDEEEEEEIIAPAPKRLRTNGDPAKDAGRTSTPPPPRAQPEPTPHPSSSQRTEHFRFASSQTSNAGSGKTEGKQPDKQREKLHQQFVRKLGGPDCALGIGRATADEMLTGAEDVAEGEEDEEPAAAAPAKGRGTAKKGGSKLTPMEKQVIEIKRKHVDTILVVEVGYKFRFFGEDARVAAKELGIVCIPGKFRFDERMYSVRADTICWSRANGGCLVV